MLPVRQLWSPEAEQAVIGAVMLRNDALVDVQGTGLRAEHFNDLSHREIWTHIESLGERGSPQDLITLSERLESAGKLADIGGDEYLVELSNKTPSSANASHYASIVVNKAQQRRMHQVLCKAAEGFMDPTIEDPVARAEQLLASLDAGHTGGELVPIKQVAKGYVVELEDRHANPGIRGLLTGYSDIDFRLKGMQDGDLIVIGARPGMGKTNYALNILRNAAATHRDRKALMFSLEMGNSKLLERMLAAQGRLQKGLLQTGKIFEHEESINRLGPAMKVLSEMNIDLCDNPRMTVHDICGMARRARRRERIGPLIVDYLGLVDHAGSDRRHDLVVDDIARNLKLLAKELGTPVILLSQLSREVDKRPNKRPVNGDLKDSGGIEAHADVVQFLYRDEVYHDDSPFKGQVDVITTKCREGEVGTDYLDWRGEYALMESRSNKDRVNNFEGYSYEGAR
ncbi:MAG: replicative DNA helicase [Gammaproteobacteria bacterium]|nr:MAG: replicative DNA helicase [Gammaproteobacteria bacterium]